MDVKLGSNAFRNTNGILAFQGREQVVLELKPETFQLLLTMDLYGEDATRIGHLRRNGWVLDKEDAFAFASGPQAPSLFSDHAWVKVTTRDGALIVFEAQVVEKGVVAVTNGHFRTHTGQLVEISTHYCRISGVATLFGDVQDMNGGPIKLG